MIGHTAIRTKLGTLIASRKLPSTLLFSGVSGIGKRLVATELSKRILCESPSPSTGDSCEACTACTVLKSGNHPDLHVLDCSGDGGAVDSIRTLLSRLSLSAFAGGNRVAILDNSDELNIAAANALLKSLEEPRPGVYFILIASTASRLPSTVLSRCQQWHFNRLTNEELETILGEIGQSVPPAVVRLAEGSVRAAMTLADSTLPVDHIVSLLKKIPNGDASAIMELARTIASDKDLIASKLAIVRTQARASMEECLGDPPLERLWSSFLANIVDAERLLLDRNFNPVSTLYTLLSILNPRHLTSFPHLSQGGTLGQDVF